MPGPQAWHASSSCAAPVERKGVAPHAVLRVVLVEEAVEPAHVQLALVNLRAPRSPTAQSVLGGRGGSIKPASLERCSQWRPPCPDLEGVDGRQLLGGLEVAGVLARVGQDGERPAPGFALAAPLALRPVAHEPPGAGKGVLPRRHPRQVAGGPGLRLAGNVKAVVRLSDGHHSGCQQRCDTRWHYRWAPPPLPPPRTRFGCVRLHRPQPCMLTLRSVSAACSNRGAAAEAFPAARGGALPMRWGPTPAFGE